MRGLLVAVTFLTRLPLRIKGSVDSADLADATGAFGLAGLLVGALIAAVDALAGTLFGPLPRSALAVVAGVLVTGALHLDGLMDTADGLGSGRDREGTLAVMRDSRVGAMGAIAGACDLLLRWAFLAALPPSGRWPALLVAPALGRAALVPAIWRYPSARGGAGLGGAVAGKAGGWQTAAAWLTTVAAAALTAGWRGAIAAVAAGLAGLGTAAFLARRLGGMTGDIYGTVNEVTELTALAVFAGHLPW